MIGTDCLWGPFLYESETTGWWHITIVRTAVQDIMVSAITAAGQTHNCGWANHGIVLDRYIKAACILVEGLLRLETIVRGPGSQVLLVGLLQKNPSSLALTLHLVAFAGSHGDLEDFILDHLARCPAGQGRWNIFVNV